MEFAEKMQKLRKQKGMSQENLAELIGVSRQAVSKWESGQSYPEMDKVLSLSELFNVSVDHLLKDTPDIPEPSQNIQNNHATDLRFMYHYEYKSKRTWFGLPLVHINIGRGMHVAKGIVAIGNIAIGVFSLGLIALGGICLGALGAGLVSMAGLAIGLLLAAGGLALGTLAMGGVAVGIFAIGGLSIGMFSIGGCALASHIAIGGYASGHIAIGDSVKGAYTLATDNQDFSSIQAEQVRALINQEYPNLWKFITSTITSIFN
jgi:transcriptional regulator with XRE-family HTH domain